MTMENLPAITSGSVDSYLMKHGVGTSGTFIKFDGKAGTYKKTSDGSELPGGTEAVVVYDQIRVGWIKFNGAGNPPTRIQGTLFEGFNPPPRDELGDTDESQWELGLSGKPNDPWQFQVMLPLQDTKTGELLIFGTSSRSGRRACDSLIAACNRMQRSEPDMYPVVRLDITGFQHKDPRIGFVKTPVFTRVGKAPKADISASVTGTDEMEDAIPF